jgi:hypothetical protein
MLQNELIVEGEEKKEKEDGGKLSPTKIRDVFSW